MSTPTRDELLDQIDAQFRAECEHVLGPRPYQKEQWLKVKLMQCRLDVLALSNRVASLVATQQPQPVQQSRPITAADVRRLAEETQNSMAFCRQALVNANGYYEVAWSALMGK